MSTADLILFEELPSGDERVEAIFRKKFNSPPPAVAHHLGVIFVSQQGPRRLASYVHFFSHGRVILVGGACTDGDVIREMPDSCRQSIVEAGGIYLAALRHWFGCFESQCDAFFGYCGDPRAYEVDIAAGFRDTRHPHLIVKFNKALAPTEQADLIDEIARLGPF